VYYFDWELPTETKEVDMKEVFSLSIHRKEKLHLVPLPRTLSYKKDIWRVQSS
jgi:hypothetical protein